MEDVIIALLAIVCNLIIFFIFGALFLRIIREKISLLWALIVGLFSFFGIFTLVYLPCMLLQTSFIFMMVVACSIILLIGVISIKVTHKEVYSVLSRFLQPTSSISVS